MADARGRTMGDSESSTERTLWHAKPAWRSFLVLYATVAFLVAMAVKEAFFPGVGRPFPLPPAPTLLGAAAILLYVILKRRATTYVVTTRRARHSFLFGLSRELELARIDELKVYQPFIQRFLGTGKIVMADSRDFSSRMQFYGVEEPKKVKETIARLIEDAKKI